MCKMETQFKDTNRLEGRKTGKKILLYQSYPQFAYNFSTFAPQLPCTYMTYQHIGSFVETLNAEDQLLLGRVSKRFANFIQKETNENFSNCCNPLGLNMTAVLTSGKSCLSSAQQKSCRLPNVPERKCA